MSETKVFISADNKATFICPKCQNVKITDVSQYKNMDRAVRVKISCPCSHVYSVLLERRKYFRKQTNLPGDCYFGTKKMRTPIIVKDISRVGLKFELQRNEKFKVGDIVLVEFKLDDKHSSLIRKDVRIRKISGLTIGGEFLELDPTSASDKALGFYLF